MVIDTVAMARPISVNHVAEHFFDGLRTLTLGLLRFRDRALWLGPIALITFGPVSVTPTSVTWPIAGGLLVGRPGGRLEVRAGGGTLSAVVEGYTPRLPHFIYAITQLPIHHLVTRFQLRRLGR